VKARDVSVARFGRSRVGRDQTVALAVTPSAFPSAEGSGAPSHCRGTIAGACALAIALTFLFGASLAAAAPAELDTFSCGDGAGSNPPPCGTNTSITPERATVDPSTGDVYVIDSANNVLDRFDADGNYLSNITGFDFSATDNDVAVDASGNVYVAQEGPATVLAFNSSGAPIAGFGTAGSLPVAQVCGVAVDSAGNLWTSSYEGGVQKLDAAGAPVGAPVATAMQSCHIAFDAKDNLYLNKYGGAVLKFTAASSYADSTTFASGNYVDVATDTIHNEVYVDTSGAVAAYTADGTPLKGTPFGSAPGTSEGVAVNGASGRVYFTDTNSGSVKIFTLPEEGSAGPMLTLAKTGAGSGTVTSDPPGIACGSVCKSAFFKGTELTLTATPTDEFSKFTGWTGCDSEAGGKCLVTMSVDKAVNANFDPVSPRTLEVVKAGAGAGIVTSAPGGIDCGPTCSKPFAEGAAVILNPDPAPHSHFSGWTGCPEVVGVTKCKVTLGASNVSVTATFAPTTHLIQVNVQGAGTVTADSGPISACSPTAGTCSGPYNESSTVLLTATPEPGSELDGWTGCPAVVGGTKCRVVVSALGLSLGAKFVPAGSAGSHGCANEALRSEQQSTFLPDCRAYEVASPPEKNGGDVISVPSRTRAAADGGAITFTSLVGFADAVGGGVGVEYIAQRSTLAQPQGTGWTTHAITPPQDSATLSGGLTAAEANYQGEPSPDLSTGVFRAWSPVTDAPEVDGVHNLYLRDDLRTPGAGHYQLLSTCPICLSTGESLLERAPDKRDAEQDNPNLVGASADFGRVFFESTKALTADAPPLHPPANNLYESDHGALRLASVLPDAHAATGAVAGQGIAPKGRVLHTSHPVSTDGSRVTFTVGRTEPTTPYTGDLYARINGRSTIRLDASERTTPDLDLPSTYWDASADGSRIFFTSNEALIDDSPGSSSAIKLYMWKRSSVDEQQSLDVDAAAGTFTLAFEGATTDPLAFDASPAVVQSALEALVTIKPGNVNVTGGPGSPNAPNPYLITFSGDFSGADVSPLQADGSALSGAAATASVLTTRPVTNLSVLNIGPSGRFAEASYGVIGASDDGHYVYFPAAGTQQLVPGAPPLHGEDAALYLWHDDTIAFIGAMAHYIFDANSFVDGLPPQEPKQTQVSGDGRHLLFSSSYGGGLLSSHGGTDYDHGIKGPEETCLEGRWACRELYLYSADADTLVCVSCNRDGSPPKTGSTIRGQFGSGGVVVTNYLARALSEDGRYAFFTTVESLLPQDTNGNKSDAYVYDAATDELHLLSSGTADSNSYFIDANPSGHDAFFTTRQQLLGWDVDSSYDLYDARIGGGFPEQPAATAPCAGADTCRDPSSPSPNLPAAASEHIQLAPPPPVDRRCPKGRRAVIKHGKTICLKRHRHHRRNANTNRRAAP
jgi:hypothetical protein